MSRTLIAGADVFTGGCLQKVDVLFDERGILEIARDLKDKYSFDPQVELVTADGLTLLPGLVDTHVHLRDPGYTEKETIETGTKAAAAGGFTTIFAMPNVKPFPSSAEVMKDYLDHIERSACVRVFPFGTITDNEAGQTPSDYTGMKELGIAWFSDDGVGVQSGKIMEEAMKQAVEADVLFSCHTEDMNYRAPQASVHAGRHAEKNGWIGIPGECESEQLKRDLKLAVKIGVRYHADHISSKQSVEALHEAKAAGGRVSAEVTAHHLLLEDRDVRSPMEKMNPPLRSHADRMALIEGLENGDLDWIANDHAPHTQEEKSRSMEQAPFGIVALETAFPLLYTHFVAKTGRWSLAQLIGWMSVKPARGFGLERTGKIEPGYRADLFLADLNADSVIDASKFVSKGKNTPFDRWKTCVTIEQTWVDGRRVWNREEG